MTAPEPAVVPPRPVLVARCENYREDLDTPCTGRIHFRWGQSQAACDTCGAHCGIAVAAWGRVELTGAVPDTGQARSNRLLADMLARKERDLIEMSEEVDRLRNAGAVPDTGQADEVLKLRWEVQQLQGMVQDQHRAIAAVRSLCADAMKLPTLEDPRPADDRVSPRAVLAALERAGPSPDTGQAPAVAATALRDAARLLDMVADTRDVYLEGMEEDSESAVAIETFGSGIRSAARILRAEPHTVELLVPTWRYLGELAELDLRVRALLGTDTTPKASSG